MPVTPRTQRCRSVTASAALRQREIDDGFLQTPSATSGFDEQVKQTKRTLLAFLIDARKRGQVGSSATARPARATRC